MQRITRLALPLFAAACQTSTAPEPAPIRDSRPPLLEFEGVVSAADGTMKITSIGGSQRGLAPSSGLVRLTTVQNKVPGSGPANSVELVTLSTGPCAGRGTFGGDVQINSFYGASVATLVAQITGLTPPTNVQPNNAGSYPPLDNSMGLWVYKGSGDVQSWCFDVLGGSDFHFRGVVWGELNFPATCQDILNGDPTSTDGGYVVDLDGPGGDPPLDVYCDMRSGGTTYVALGFGGHGVSYSGLEEITLAELNDPLLQQAFAFVYNLYGLINLDLNYTSNNCCFKTGDAQPGEFLSLRPSDNFGYVYPFGSNGDNCNGTYEPQMLFTIIIDDLVGGYVSNPMIPAVTPVDIFNNESPTQSNGCADDGNPAMFWFRIPPVR